MSTGTHTLASIVGAGIVGCVAHTTVMASGGYGTHGAPLVIALSIGLVAGSIAIGVACRERRRTVALLLAVCLLAGEAWALLATAERTLEHRDAHMAPARAAREARTRAEHRLVAAEAVLAALPATSERLTRALAVKTAADAAVVSKSAERGCVAVCRDLLQSQVATAAAEIAMARTEMERAKLAAEAAVTAARATVDVLPPPRSGTTLADRLGLEGWQIDLVAAALASFAANGLGAVLIAFGVHGAARRRPVPTIEASPVHIVTRPVESPPKVEQIEAEQPELDQPKAEAPVVPNAAPSDVAPVAAPPAPIAPPPTVSPRRDASIEADGFARAMFRPAADGRVRLADIRMAYHRWCAARNLDPLPDREIGGALNALFTKVGLYRDGLGSDAAIVGIRWSTPLPALLEAA